MQGLQSQSRFEHREPGRCYPWRVGTPERKAERAGDFPPVVGAGSGQIGSAGHDVRSPIVRAVIGLISLAVLVAIGWYARR